MAQRSSVALEKKSVLRIRHTRESGYPGGAAAGSPPLDSRLKIAGMTISSSPHALGKAARRNQLGAGLRASILSIRLVLLLAILSARPAPLLAYTCTNPGSNLGFIEKEADGVNGVDGLNGGEAVAVSPDGKHVYTAAYFDHAVAAFTRNESSGHLTFIAAYKHGDGNITELRNARNVTVSPDGAYVYAVADLDDSLTVFSRNSTSGALTWVAHYVDDSGGIDGLDDSRGVAVSPDGTNVYVSGHVDDEVAWFTRNANGTLTWRGKIGNVSPATALNGPWDIAVSADGKFVYVACYHGNSVVVLARDANNNGALSFVEEKIDGQGGVDGLDDAKGVALSADGASVYVTGVGDHAVAVFSRNATDGKLTFRHAIKDGDALPGGGTLEGLGGATWPATGCDDTVTYASAQLDAAVVMLTRNTSTGDLSYKSKISQGDPLPGGGEVDGLQGARGIAVAPGGAHIYVLGYSSDTLVALGQTFDPTHTPTITPTSTPTPTDTPTITPTWTPNRTCEIDGSVPSALHHDAQFLYQGCGGTPGPQASVTAIIEPPRMTVIRGSVSTADLVPLEGVSITLLGQPEYGSTLTPADGVFSFVLNGGGYVTIDYQKDGYIPVQRQVHAPWGEYTWAGNVVMIPYAGTVTTIDCEGSEEPTLIEGEEIVDELCPRQTWVYVPPLTTCELYFADGSTEPVTTLDMHVTEFTVGDSGPEAMPADLPPTSAYTYAAEFAADEAIASGAGGVQFSNPVYVYVPNCLDLPCGPVPSGYYDRTEGQWMCAENGQVIEVLTDSGSIVTVDTDCDGIADEELGITPEEREVLSALFDAGDTLWRVPTTHFTPFDFNWAFRMPAGAGPPNAAIRRDERTEVCAGDPEELEEQEAMQSVPIVGTPFELIYDSGCVPGRKAEAASAGERPERAPGPRRDRDRDADRRALLPGGAGAGGQPALRARVGRRGRLRACAPGQAEGAGAGGQRVPEQHDELRRRGDLRGPGVDESRDADTDRDDPVAEPAGGGAGVLRCARSGPRGLGRGCAPPRLRGRSGGNDRSGGQCARSGQGNRLGPRRDDLCGHGDRLPGSQLHRRREPRGGRGGDGRDGARRRHGRRRRCAGGANPRPGGGQRRAGRQPLLYPGARPQPARAPRRPAR
jgi:6-phosphogluconolactonase (cycloisomerase 2 family)